MFTCEISIEKSSTLKEGNLSASDLHELKVAANAQIKLEAESLPDGEYRVESKFEENEEYADLDVCYITVSGGKIIAVEAE